MREKQREGRGENKKIQNALWRRCRIIFFFLSVQTISGCHEAGIVHHDISAGNVLTTTAGQTVLIDWESAFPCKGQQCKHFDIMPGTPGFSAPEDSCSPKRDVYSCAALFVYWVGALSASRLHSI